MGEGMTPVIRFDDNVLLKMDYLMPTLSFKDRSAQLSSSPTAAEGVGLATTTAMTAVFIAS